MSRCRSCRAPMLWARTEKGKRMPLDPDPYQGESDFGLFVLRDRQAPVPLAMAVPGRQTFPGEPVYVSHFATCPDRDEHRRSR